MLNNFLYALININFYRWGGSIINRLFRRKISLKSNKFINFANNLKAFLRIKARAIIPPLIYIKGLPKALQRNKSKRSKNNDSDSNLDFNP